jgi:hypothetical protein
MARSTITTSDNPFNPFTQYDLWYDWDANLCGYNSNQYLASVAPWSPKLTSEEEEFLNERGIEKILEDDLPIFSPFTGERVHFVRFTEE